MSHSHGFKEEHKVHLGDNERILSAVGGSLLLYFVTKKHTLNSLFMLGGGYLLYRAVSGKCPVADTLHRRPVKSLFGSNINIRASAIVNRPVGEVYAFWKEPENWPRLFTHINRVEAEDEDTAVWSMDLPDIGSVSWRTRLVKERKNAELSWHSVAGAAIDNMGKINFSATAGNATRVDVVLSYRAPAGPVDDRLERLLTPAFRHQVEQEIRQMPDVIGL